MPELPEVETIRRGLELELRSRRIVRVESRPARLRGGPSPRPLAELAGRRVTDLRRHGKYLLVALDDDSTLLIHLGMTGKLLFAAAGEPERPHTHVVLWLDDGRELRFSDPRRFGLVKLYAPRRPIPDLAHYGVDALDPGFTPEALAALLKGARTSLKAFLLDQRRISGIGNIYACEALWRAGLSPRRQAARTPKAKVPALHSAIVGVLRDALDAGGTSFNDYVDHIGQPGNFVADLTVFQREGLPCPRCGAAVRRIVQSGRSTFYCPACQR